MFEVVVEDVDVVVVLFVDNLLHDHQPYRWGRYLYTPPADWWIVGWTGTVRLGFGC